MRSLTRGPVQSMMGNLMRSLLLATVLILILPLSLTAQRGLGVEELMNDGRPRYMAERLIVVQDPAIDTLVSRHILMNASKNGVDGWRIQIYRGGHRTANEDSNRIRARFMEDYPEIPTYRTFDRPNWFKVKVGDFRTREEAARVFFDIQGKYPDAYLIRDVIAFKTPVK
ncbi:MAG: SPOR domain-containing protein [Bacteroidales bacterium]|nr:SPOR domain-containing protein [Bacteroidales bacterium]MDX9928144.1 SPOR domain-containing protein [Bacteroidales bacterium]